MAHLIHGLDVGSYSVKVAVLEAGFRQSRMLRVFEERVPDGEAPLAERQAEALRAVAARLSAEATVYATLPGELMSIRALELPFSDPRKIEQVVGYELEGQIVHALEDVVFDHVVVQATGAGSTVLAAAARRDDIAAYLALLQGQEIDPRALGAAPLGYRAVAPAPLGPPEPGAPPECVAILDLGHMRTNVCVLRDGEPVFGRTIMRGGFHLSAAIADAFRCSAEEAETGKLREGFVASTAAQPDTPLQRRLDEVLRRALAPLVRELRQTLASFRAGNRPPVETLLLTGGTGRLGGLGGYLSDELEVRVGLLPVGPQDAGEAAGLSSTFALATATARAAARGKKEIDFRRGPFVYRANVALLRGKGVHVAMLVIALAGALGLDGVAALSRLNKEKEELDAELKNATQELFGEPRTDAKAVSLLLKKGFKEDMAPLPRATAFDLLDQISRKVPPADRIDLDVTELDIRAKKTFIKGTVDSAAAVDEIAARLKEIDCFDEVTKGAITEVSGGAKQFTLTIASRCL